MSESGEVLAAATGAAAAVAAVQDEQAELERAAAIEDLAGMAAGAATVAAGEAETASENAEMAAAVAAASAEQSQIAGEKAEQAGQIAYASLQALEDFRAEFAAFATSVDSRLAVPAEPAPATAGQGPDQPEEIPVASDSSTQGGEDSSGTVSRSRRHRFGR